MAASSSSMAQLTRPGVQPKEAGLQPNAKFKRLYGIPPKGKPPKGGWADSDYGFPVPPSTHPDALKYARGVLARAHMSKNFAAADLKRQIAKAQAIVKKHDKSYKPSKSAASMAKGTKESRRSAGKLREYIPSTPPGSWERISVMIQKAAQSSSMFGGPADDDPKEDSATTVRSWDIFIYASYPADGSVVIANDKLGKLWQTSYAVKDGNVSFSDVKPVKLAFAQEAKRKAAAAKKPRASAGKPAPLAESLRFVGRLREGGIDLEKGQARVILIRAGAGNAADKHYYTPECLEDAVERHVFEAAQNYIDHPSKIEDQIIPERMVEKLGGWFCDVEMAACENDEGITVPCIEATFIPEPGNELVVNKLRAAQVYAKQFDGRPYIGFSINAAGIGAAAEIDGRQYNRVDRITEVISVDLVTRAGAGGKLLQLKESARMAKARKEAAKTNIVRSLKGAIKEAGIGLSQEQDEALDKALGIEDGGALDNLLDQVTMGGAESEEGKKREDALDGADDPDEDNPPADDAPNPDEPANDPDEPGEDDDEDIDEMDESDLKAALRAARKHEREAKKHESAARREAATAKREAQRARIASQGILREREAARVLEKLNPPAAHRPRMLREMRQATKLSEMESIAKEYATAFLGGGDLGAGAGAASGQHAAAVKINCLAD